MVAALLGLVTGAVTSPLQTVLEVPWAALANAASPWLAVAFLGGLLSPHPRTAAVAGMLTCVGEVVGYYGVSALREFGVDLYVVGFWLSCGLLGGAALGVLGYLWKTGSLLTRLMTSSALAAGFLLEAIRYEIVLGYRSRAILFAVIAALISAIGVGASRSRQPDESGLLGQSGRR